MSENHEYLNQCAAQTSSSIAWAVYVQSRDILVQYMRSKIEAHDWHAVRDAAVDIEILEARAKATGLAP